MGKLTIPVVTQIADMTGRLSSEWQQFFQILYDRVGGVTGDVYGEIYGHDVSDTITISGTGIANKVQVGSFDTNGANNNCTPDHANDHITVRRSGDYLVLCNIECETVVGSGYTVGFSMFKNNGATELQNLHTRQRMSGVSSHIESVSFSGITSLSLDDTLELWLWNDTNTSNVTINSVNVCVRRMLF